MFVSRRAMSKMGGCLLVISGACVCGSIDRERFRGRRAVCLLVCFLLGR